MAATQRIARVAVDEAALRYDKLYSYRVPAALADRVFLGGMVLAPFGRGDRPRLAVVLALEEGEPSDAGKLKELLDAAPEDARLTPHLLELVHFLHERTFCTWFEAVKAVIPYGAQYEPAHIKGVPALKKRMAEPVERVYSLAAPLPDKPRPGPRQRQAVQALHDGPLGQKQLQAQGVSRATLDSLCAKGVLRVSERRAERDLLADLPFDPQPLTLSPAQRAACDTLLQDLRAPGARTALLYGVTGSGKTAVFEELIDQTLAMGRTALVLVPEIGLTPQMLRRLKARFGSRLAVQHSALSNTERLMQWQRIQHGEADIVVGTRSAVFAPLPDLGLIVLDEEQEHTYRSESSPRYDAHAVARKRALQEGALLLYASATPRTETWHAAQSGRIRLVCLPERYGGRPLPQVDIVDMRAELAAGNPREVSLPLAQALRQTLDSGQQSILLLNRRGYHTVAMCTSCGQAVKCPYCSVPMVYHKTRGALLCHHCGQQLAPAPAVCPQCGGKLAYSGFGTQKVEEELARLLPQARVLRMDQDSTGQKNAHARMLDQFARGQYDILLGTQMVAKGLDFDRVTLVGVLGIDSLLFGQGFRAYENAFSLITQVVGRGGRARLPGRALIQTAVPGHPVLHLAAAQDYPAFYKQEIAFRRYGLYPPFCAFCVVGFSGGQDAGVLAAARRFGEVLARNAAAVQDLPLRILGPVPMNIALLAGKYRYKLTLKCRGDAAFRTLLRQTLAACGEDKACAGVAVTVDFNSDGDL